MRKLVMVLSIGLAWMAGSDAWGQEPWANKIFGGVTSKDFGTVAKGVQLKYAFKMTNIYKVPLEITNTRVTCGCVTVTPSTKVLEPNETAFLNINMDSRRFTGLKTVQIFVTVGPQYISTATLAVTASTRQDVVLNPGEIDFGIVQHGSDAAHTIDVEYAGAADWRVTEIIKNGSAPFNLKVEELPRGGIGQVKRVGYRITATIKPDAPAGTFNEEVLLKTTDPASPVLTFNIVGNVQASLTAAPAVVSLDGVRPGEVQEKKIVVRGRRPFRITSVDGQGAGITVEASKNRVAATHIVTVRCQMAQASDISKVLTIHTDLDRESVSVRVEARP